MKKNKMTCVKISKIKRLNLKQEKFNQEIIKNSDDEIYKGVSLIQNKLFDTLKSKGLKIVEVNKGDSFDADDHEAVTQIAAPSEDLKGKIIDVIDNYDTTFLYLLYCCLETLFFHY